MTALARLVALARANRYRIDGVPLGVWLAIVELERGRKMTTLEAFEGKVVAVCVHDDHRADRAIAVFKYRDQAEEWARKEYGTWKGWDFRMTPGVHLEVIDAPAGVELCRIDAERTLAANEGEAVIRFWVRWFGGSRGDPRPVIFPAPFDWWCSGTDGEGDVCTLCAVIDAEDEAAVWASVRTYWPEAMPSFCESKPADWRPEASRFPAAKP